MTACPGHPGDLEMFVMEAANGLIKGVESEVAVHGALNWGRRMNGTSLGIWRGLVGIPSNLNTPFSSLVKSALTKSILTSDISNTLTYITHGINER